MDVVTEVLRLSGFRGTLGPRLEAGQDWSVDLSDYPGMAMHAVLAGDAWVGTDEGRQLHLAVGDVVLMPTRTPHVLSDHPDVVVAEHPLRHWAQESSPVLALGSGPTRTRLLTVFYDCDHTTRTRVLDESSDFLHVSGGEGGAAYLDDIVRLLGRELAQPQLATTTVINSLVDIILIQLIRAWTSLRATDRRGTWLGWVEDPVVRDAVDRFHDDPADDWTATTLATATSVSRATLARRFQAAMGQSPASYVAQWRMDLAAVRLRDTDESIETIAPQVGYRSVPSFTRAFARDRGQTPGAYRTEARAHHRQRGAPGPRSR